MSRTVQTPGGSPQSLIGAETLDRINAVTPAGSYNDFNPPGASGASRLVIQSSGAVTLTGLAGGVDGRELCVQIIGGGTLTLSDESASSAAANRFSGVSSIAAVASGTLVNLLYDAISARWLLRSNSAAAGGGTTNLNNFESIWYYGIDLTAGSVPLDLSLTKTANAPTTSVQWTITRIIFSPTVNVVANPILTAFGLYAAAGGVGSDYLQNEATLTAFNALTGLLVDNPVGLGVDWFVVMAAAATALATGVFPMAPKVTSVPPANMFLRAKTSAFTNPTSVYVYGQQFPT